MKNENWNVDNIVKKWSPVMESLNFSKGDLPKVCEYAELHALTELAEREMLTEFPQMRSTTIDQPLISNNLLPMSLKVLRGINDLSKVHFTGQPAFRFMRNSELVFETVKAHVMTIAMKHEDYIDIHRNLGIDVLNNLESVIIQEVTEQLNKIIEEGNEIYIYLAVAGIRMMSEGVDGLNPKLTLISRYHVEPGTISLDDIEEKRSFGE